VAILSARYPLEPASRIALDLCFSEKQVHAKAFQLKLKKDAAHWKVIGYERVATNGYWEQRMAKTGSTRRDYVPVHHLVWQEAGGYGRAGDAL
jgi:hypothetical protein